MSVVAAARCRETKEDRHHGESLTHYSSLITHHFFMRLFHGTDNAEIARPTVLTLGVFDGLHLGL